MRIVLDTNILISATITDGRIRELFLKTLIEHDLVTSEAIINEYRDKLLHKFKYTKKEVDEAIEITFRKMEIVEPMFLEIQVSEDVDDDVIIGTALAGKCDCIISGDPDLYSLRQYRSIKIITPAQFRVIVEE